MPTLIFLDLGDDASTSAKPTPLSPAAHPPHDARSQAYPDVGSPRTNFYGLALLKHFKLEMSESKLSKLTVPVAFVHSNQDSGPGPNGLPVSARQETDSEYAAKARSTSTRTITLLQEGAVDVIESPFAKERLDALGAHAYRAHIEGHRTQAAFLESRQMRKRSWVGVDEEKPFAYLREAMYVTESLFCALDSSLVLLHIP